MARNDKSVCVNIDMSLEQTDNASNGPLKKRVLNIVHLEMGSFCRNGTFSGMRTAFPPQVPGLGTLSHCIRAALREVNKARPGCACFSHPTSSGDGVEH